jgi:DNA polymerase-3 subunit epsilon
LFPDQPRHNLDTTISAHGLSVSARHRALGDADLLLQFWRVCEQKVGPERLLNALNQLIGHATLPPHIDQSLIDAIPDAPGCYIMYGENRTPLYIGKSIALRTRVVGHFQAALTNRKEMKLSMQVLRPSLVSHQELNPGLQDNLYGLFYSKREAHAYLEAVSKKYRLCAALLGLEKVDEGKSCFAYQVKQCAGACVGMSPIDMHNLQVQTALNFYKIQAWPYQSPIAVREGDEMIVLNNWCYLGTAINEEELYELADSEQGEFDLDIYKLLKKALAGPFKQQVIKLNQRN